MVTSMWARDWGIKSPTSWALIPRDEHLIYLFVVRVLRWLASVWILEWKFVKTDMNFGLRRKRQWGWWLSFAVWLSSTSGGDLRRDRGWWISGEMWRGFISHSFLSFECYLVWWYIVAHLTCVLRPHLFPMGPLFSVYTLLIPYTSLDCKLNLWAFSIWARALVIFAHPFPV